MKSTVTKSQYLKKNISWKTSPTLLMEYTVQEILHLIKCILHIRSTCILRCSGLFAQSYRMLLHHIKIKSHIGKPSSEIKEYFLINIQSSYINKIHLNA